MIKRCGYCGKWTRETKELYCLFCDKSMEIEALIEKTMKEEVMSIFVYTCKLCKAKKEVLLKWKDLPKTLKCYRCAGLMYRDLSAEQPNFHFIGDGWSKDGYSKKE